MKKIAITGATGFVGKNLISYLAKYYFTSVTISRKELNSDVNFESSNAVIHLSGKAHDLKKAANANEYYEVNFELTKKLYDHFLKSNAAKFIFISSVKAAADTVNGILTEEIFPNPQTDYGKSKLMAEAYIQQQPLPKGKSYYILRPCMIHGPGNKGNLNLLYKFVQKGIPYPLAAFENKRSFLSVENLCFVIKSLIEKDIPSGIYNVADDEALSTNEVVEILSESLEKKPKLWKISSSFIRFVARVGDIIKFPLNTERLDKLTENYIVSNSKIKRAVNSKLPLSTKEGLKITANSFRSPIV
ncbi:NAD-dependent epimerase/dehydratase family protein [Pedobacter fastidiosus]|uniref:NAD-dependent epimerase/dehydratase family protein n=1 Tax=Pedobacter fastidiosus TaxID=2765361 RepID=A0ABR7KR31_9SPHI|nr:NAD-dependent epimerase/dehydratase family protein [Pedobacter fastidiosus]MBC6110541.1 NAD-dependent epimerase/dehydratase family protein [Pedobacter fastidiosus]